MSFDTPAPDRYGTRQFSPQAVLLAAILLLIGASFCQQPLMLLCIFAVCAILAVILRIDLPGYFLRTGAAAAVFALPVGLASIASAGYHGIGISARVDMAGLLILRGLAAASICMLLVQSIGWQSIITGVRNLRAPVSLVDALAIAGMQIALLRRDVNSINAGRRVRMIVRPSMKESARSVGIRSAVLLSRSLQSAGMVEAAMNARCITPALPSLSAPSHFRRMDILLVGLAGILATGCAL